MKGEPLHPSPDAKLCGATACTSLTDQAGHHMSGTSPAKILPLKKRGLIKDGIRDVGVMDGQIEEEKRCGSEG